jgi:hypothetical protein
MLDKIFGLIDAALNIYTSLEGYGTAVSFRAPSPTPASAIALLVQRAVTEPLNVEPDAAERVVLGTILRNRLVRAVRDNHHHVDAWTAYVAALSKARNAAIAALPAKNADFLGERMKALDHMRSTRVGLYYCAMRIILVHAVDRHHLKYQRLYIFSAGCSSRVQSRLVKALKTDENRHRRSSA